MQDLTLTVRWPSAVEKIFLGDIQELSEGAVVVSTEKWLESDAMPRYRSTVEHLTVTAEQVRLVLRYREDENPDAFMNDAWGLSWLVVSLASKKGTAVWQDDRPGPRYGSGRRPVVLRADDQAVQPELHNALVRVRKQNRIRRELLDLYKVCVVTGEKLPQALDAAHILEVKENAGFSVSNGLLLRADIHRLFDARLLRIESDGRISLRTTKKSKYVQQPFRLNPLVPAQARKNLSKRNKADDA